MEADTKSNHKLCLTVILKVFWIQSLAEFFKRMLMLSSKPKHCTSTQLKVIDDLHLEEIEILNDCIRLLPKSDDDQSDEWLQRLEG